MNYILISIASGVVIVATRLYHLLFHPEWTEAQSLLHLWLPYLIAFILITVGLRRLLKEEP